MNDIKLNPGEILPNGAIVLKHCQVTRLLLALNPGACQPFVIWSVDTRPPSVEGEHIACYLGDYFEELQDATESLETRITGVIRQRAKHASQQLK